MIPTNSPTTQSNLPIPQLPPAPIIAPTVPAISTAPPRLMGRKNSSMYFQQPSKRSQSFSTIPDNDRTLFVSVEGNTMWDIGGLHPRTSSKRPRSSTLEVIPDFFLPEPATGGAVMAWKPTVGPCIVRDAEMIRTTDNDNGGGGNGGGNAGGQLGHRRKKRRAMGNSTLLPICGAEGKVVVTFGDTTTIPIEKMRFLSLDDENEGNGEKGSDGGMSRSKD